jgi:hemolysin III
MFTTISRDEAHGRFPQSGKWVHASRQIFTDAAMGDGRQADFPWDYDRSEIIADGMIHALGICLGLIGIVSMIVTASLSTRSVMITSVWIYAAGLVAMLGFSAAYNMWPISPTKWILRRFDHSAIYLLIASTYTPFIVQLKNSLASSGLLVGVWLTAGVGIMLKLTAPGRFDRAAVVLYLALGWSAVVAYRFIIAPLPSLTVWLLAAGGVLYSAGVVFHVWRSLRFQNAIWHAFVLLAACCHYTAVLEYAVLPRG